MKAKLILTTLMAAPLVGFAFTKTLPLDPSSTLIVEGTSTVRGFKCAAKKIDANVLGQENAPVATLVNSATITVPVSQLDCGNGKMNEHMQKALKADQFADVQFTLDSYALTGSEAVLKGNLKIAGVVKPIEIPATVQEDAGNAVRVKATKTIDMTQWSVKPPSLMMGTMKVKPTVNVTFDVSIKR